MKQAIAIVVVLVAGCASGSSNMPAPQRLATRVGVHIIPEDWDMPCPASVPRCRGMAQMPHSWRGGCEIYVPEPRHRRDYDAWSTWGHELGHCIYGDFHPR